MESELEFLENQVSAANLNEFKLQNRNDELKAEIEALKQEIELDKDE